MKKVKFDFVVHRPNGDMEAISVSGAVTEVEGGPPNVVWTPYLDGLRTSAVELQLSEADRDNITDWCLKLSREN